MGFHHWWQESLFDRAFDRDSGSNPGLVHSFTFGAGD